MISKCPVFPTFRTITSHKKLQEDLDRICHWAKDNKLKLNAEKSKAIVIGSDFLIKAVLIFLLLFVSWNHINSYPTEKKSQNDLESNFFMEQPHM